MGIIWDRVTNSHYKHTLHKGEPLYGTFMYSFVNDSELTDACVYSIESKRKVRVLGHFEGKFVMPSHRDFLRLLNVSSTGGAFYKHDGYLRRLMFGIDSGESFSSHSYVIRADFIKENETDPDVTEDEISEILDRISSNAVIYKEWIST